MATSYADSAQARDWDRRYDAWGRERKSTPDQFYDYKAAEQMLADRQALMAEERKSLKRRIAGAIVQMEAVCPPKRGAE